MIFVKNVVSKPNIFGSLILKIVLRRMFFMIKIKNANFVCTMKHMKLQNFDPEQIEFLARVSEQIGFFYIIYTPEPVSYTHLTLPTKA